ncbi:hypothetical protein K443DRAFT_578331 [Laccaria amethystina LaAM-08-1]|uniref:Uncharacterized protein n=1 Tax=Laccaria amethystina LaAM-08-1 TaxID=1095629 RepID=A0A0C9WRH2_9AGAR|nr:hypothetical protein K443DRAFT_578331 [Laccaria amethystina LaAM-08-1]
MPPSQNTTPELYLSLLSGRHSDVSHLSTEQCHPFPNDPDRLMDLLDALAAVCIRKEKGEVFFVSLAMDLKAVTLYVSSNKSVPATVISHLHKIQGQLKELRKVVEPNPSIPADNETSPDPNKTQSRTDGELELQKTIYEHSYSKLRRRFFKRAPAILAIYKTTVKSLQANDKDAERLHLTHWALEHIQGLLQNDRPPCSLTDLIETIDGMSAVWRDCLNAAGSEDILTRWDNLIYADRIRKLSLRRLLKKLFTLHHHIRTITRIAWSRRLSPFLEGQFDVVSVPAARGDISITFSQQDVLPVIFPLGEQKELLVCDELLKRLREKATNEGIELKNGTKLSMKTVVHAESTLLAYHLQHLDINPYHYFGGSKLSCHGCATLFSSFNLVAESFHHPQFFTKGCHNKIYLRWSCPSLLPLEQSKRLQPGTPSLDTEVRKKMIAALSTELSAYVNELRAVVEGPSRPQLDSTTASGDSRESAKEGRRLLKVRMEAGMCE